MAFPDPPALLEPCSCPIRHGASVWGDGESPGGGWWHGCPTVQMLTAPEIHTTGKVLGFMLMCILPLTHFLNKAKERALAAGSKQGS